TAAPRSNSALLWIIVIVGFVAAGVAAGVYLSGAPPAPEDPGSAVKTPSPAPSPPVPSLLERDLDALRSFLAGPVEKWKTPEIELLLRRTMDAAGPRREEVDKLGKQYDRGLH